MVKQYDYLFAGAGASTTLLLMSMEKKGMLINKNIAIIDPDNKSKNDKTYCFWAKKDEPISIDCNHLISHRWNKIIVNQNIDESIHPLEYIHIKGQEVYAELNRIIDKFNIIRLYEYVNEITKTAEVLQAFTNGNIYKSKIIFDSRTPSFVSNSEIQYQLHQSFIGYLVESKNNLALHDAVRLMDFDVDQQNHTQFMYVLPFNSNKVLFEITRFGANIISIEEAEDILMPYIRSQIGEYKVLETETGCIPMSNAKIVRENITNLVPIGARAGAVKASTGYAFKKMYEHADTITECLLKNKNELKINSNAKFNFYDRLLLQILKHQAYHGKEIFQTLFKKNKAIDVLHFIEEKTNLKDDIKILFSLPIIPFLKALFFDLNNQIKSIASPLLLLLLTLVLILFKNDVETKFEVFQMILFAFGLFIVGIPHGAVDNIVESRNLNEGLKISFIVNYLTKAILYFLVWMILPTLALIIFISYSAWHFGQADMKEWFPEKVNLYKNFIWGFALIAMILLGHLSETNKILIDLGSQPILMDEKIAKLSAYLISFCVLVWSIYERRLAMLISVVTLTLSLYLPLISSFGLYFIGQHSVTGWKHLTKTLKSSHLNLFKKALPYNIGAWLLFALLIVFYNYNLWLSSLFILISCISLPHVILMHRFYNESI